MFTDWISTGCVNDQGVASLQCIFPLFQNIITAAFIFAAVVALFLIIWSGIQFINSGGDAKKADSARKTLTYAILGLVLVLLSYFIISLISFFTGVDCIKFFGFDNCT